MKQVGIEQSDADYHSHPAIGSTTLKGYMNNAVKAYKMYLGEIKMKKSEALVMGSLIHLLALTPHTFDDEFYIVDDEYKPYNEETMQYIQDNIATMKLVVYPREVLTPSGALSSSMKAKALISDFKAKHGNAIFVTPLENAGFSLWLTTKDKNIITKKQYNFAEEIAKKALDYEFQVTTPKGVFTFTLTDAVKHESAIMERAFYAWYDPLTQEVSMNKSSAYCIELKTKPDILLDVGNGAYVAIDLKTAIDASPQSFRKGGGFFYHLQEAHYTKVLEANGLKIYKFKFLFVSKEDWGTAQDYEFDIASRELGVDHFHKALKMHQLALNGEVRETVFDGEKYDREPVIGLPNYMFYLD